MLIEEKIEESKKKFAQVVKERLEEEMSSAESTKEKGDQFLIWAVTSLVDASEDEIRHQITDGSSDMGIDAWIRPDIESENGGVIQLFQSKYNTSHDEKEILKFQADVDKFLDSEITEIKREEMQILLGTIRKKKLEAELFYVTDQEVSSTPKDSKVKVFGFSQIVDKLWTDISGIPPGKKQKIVVEQFLERNNSLISVVSLPAISKFLKFSEDYIYESNIRKYLQRTKINKGLKKTLQEDSTSVFFFNNGITIVVKDYEKNGNEITLFEPQIVNGAQTSKTISESFRLFDDIPGEILVTIIKETDKTTRNDITRFRNSQNAVKGKDLIALEAFHTGIRAQLSRLGYFYEQQAGGWLFLKETDKAGAYTGHNIYRKYLPAEHENCISSSDAIQCMVAGIFQNPTKPYSSKASFMPYGASYSKIFNDRLEQDYRLLFYPYLIRSYSETIGYGQLDSQPTQKRYARLLFVTAYFKILFDFVLKKTIDEIKAEPKLLEPIFMNFDANKELLVFTESILEHYFGDAQYHYDSLNAEEEKSVTWHNFFSNYAWDAELQKRLASHVKNRKDHLKNIRKKFEI